MATIRLGQKTVRFSRSTADFHAFSSQTFTKANFRQGSVVRAEFEQIIELPEINRGRSYSEGEDKNATIL